MIPEFEDNGLLPAGLIKPTLSFFEKRFVTECSASTTRYEIFNGYLKFCSKLLSLNVANLQWVNGSFTTNKLNPNDIDFVTHMDADKLRNCDEQAIILLRKLTDWQRVKTECKCDAYFISVYTPENPELYTNMLEDKAYWSKLFSHDREDNPKGLIEFDLSNGSFDIANCNGGIISD